MANMVYANPFGAAAEGQRYGIDAALKLGQAGRQFRNEDQNYDFMKWYDPYRRNEAAYKEAIQRQQAAQAALQGATSAGIASGNFTPAQQILQQYYGIAPQGQRTPDETQKGFVYGAFNPQLSIGDVSSAGGASKLVPQTPMSPMDQQIQRISQEKYLEYLQNDPYRLHQQQPQVTGESQGGMDLNPFIQGTPPPIPGIPKMPATPTPPPVSFPGGGPPTTNYGLPSSSPLAHSETQPPMDFSHPSSKVGSHDWGGWAGLGANNIGGVSM